jgi:hypothetical protein
MAKDTITKKEISDRIKLSINRLTDNLESNLKVFKRDELIASLVTIERAENILQVSREIKRLKTENDGRKQK